MAWAEIQLTPSFEPWQPKNPDNAVVVLMSGGVDSSVTARLLQEQGREICGVTMRIPQARGGDHPRPCCGWEAAQVCRQLGIPHYFADTDAAFLQLVIEPFRRAYAAGETPSPCIDCNTALKFGAVRAAVWRELRVRNIATGHYARITTDAAGRWRLGCASDDRRDQSYFLYGILREDLPHTLFPLAQITKDEVRRKAAELGLSSADRPDSMELCFAGEGDYRNALGVALPERPAGGRNPCACGASACTAEDSAEQPKEDSSSLRKKTKDERRRERTIPINDETAGPILSVDARQLGRHNGIWNFTPGQRKGIGVAAKEPLYVLRLDPARNAVIVGPREEAFTDIICATRVNVLCPEELGAGAELFGRIRNTGRPAPCRVEAFDAAAGTLRTRFAQAVFAPAAGQHLVLYNAAGEITAGGVIRSELR